MSAGHQLCPHLAPGRAWPHGGLVLRDRGVEGSWVPCRVPPSPVSPHTAKRLLQEVGAALVRCQWWTGDSGGTFGCSPFWDVDVASHCPQSEQKAHAGERGGQRSPPWVPRSVLPDLAPRPCRHRGRSPAGWGGRKRGLGAELPPCAISCPAIEPEAPRGRGVFPGSSSQPRTQTAQPHGRGPCPGLPPPAAFLGARSPARGGFVHLRRRGHVARGVGSCACRPGELQGCWLGARSCGGGCFAQGTRQRPQPAGGVASS